MRTKLLFVCLLTVAGCSEIGFGDFSSFGDGAGTVYDAANREYYPDDQLLVSARLQFLDRNYGMSHALYKRAIEVYPNDPQALLGYAASLDMLKKFDQADAVYRQLQPMVGNTIPYHNNFGYSQLLRGNLQAARQHFLIAYEMDPSNPVTANNLELLRNSIDFPRRAPGDLTGL
jgi:Flp pilus assembly protein TadD